MLEFWIKYLVVLLAASIVFANVEVQAEGKDGGFGKNMPTWEWKNKWLMKISGGRALKGYHLYMGIFMCIIVHVAVPFGGLAASWSWQSECLLLSFLPLFFVMEDFLWFVFNPGWFQKFRKKEVWWHRFRGPAPDFYWIFMIISGLLIYFGWSAVG